MTSIQAAPSPRTTPRHARGLAALLAALLLLALGAAPAPASAAAGSTAPAAASTGAAGHGALVPVMTRNLYLGASLSPLFPDPPLATPEEAFAAATEVWHQALATDFPRRAGALAREIALTRPALIGLQEVTLYRVGPPQDPAPAEVVRLDFLEVLQAELRARGLRYRVVVSQDAFDGELTALDWPAPSGTGGPVDVRLTDRDVILVREGAGLRVGNAQGGLFTAALPLEVLGQPLPIVRGWTSVDVRAGHRAFRFVNTHLEAFSPEIAFLQADELVTAGPAATRLPVVLVGDFNAEPGQPAYDRLAAAGFVDAAPAGRPTCCFDDLLADPGAEATTRIDAILHRGPFRVLGVRQVGDRPVFRTPPLYASDHIGVVAWLVVR